MIALWTATLAVGLTALALGLVGLVSGRIDRRVLTNRRRLTVLAAVGLLLVFAGSAPPTRGAASQTALPDDTRSVPIRTLLEQLETRAVLRSDTDVLPEQQAAYEAWERQVVAGYEKAEQSLAAVPNVMNALHENQLDRFTAWVHLARLKQDTNQVRLAVDAVVPPAVLDLAMKRRLQDALDGLNESLQHRRRYIAHLQHHVRTLAPEELERAADELELGWTALFGAAMEMTWVKGRLGLLRETPAATATSTDRPDGWSSVAAGPIVH